jgi:hypothetical protein
MYVIYSVNVSANTVTLLCFTERYETAVDALDNYAISYYRHKVPTWDNGGNKEATPMDDTSDMCLKSGYYLRFDTNPKHISDEGDPERINLYKVSKDNTDPVLLRYFSFSRVDKYIDDFMAEQTQAVIDLIRDQNVSVPINILDAASPKEDEEVMEEVDSDEDF